MYTAETEIDKPDELNWSMAYYNHILNTQPIDYSDELYGRFKITKEQVIDAYELAADTDNIELAGVVSRKKQFIPTFVVSLQK